MKRRILVVDDDREIQLLLKDFLEEEAFSVDTATDGMVALEKLEASLYDVIVLDLTMPRMNGLELLQMLNQRQRAWAWFPVVIAMSADMLGLQQAARMGVSVLSKPFDLDALLVLCQEPSRLVLCQEPSRLVLCQELS